MPKFVIWHHFPLALGSRSKVGVKVTDQAQQVTGQGQISGVQRSILGVWLC